MKFKFKKDATPFCNTHGIYYSLFGGSLRPFDYVEDSEELGRLEDAMEIVAMFAKQFERSGHCIER